MTTTDLFNFFSSPEGLILLTTIAVGFASVYLLRSGIGGGGKRERVIIFHRLKPSSDNAGGIDAIYIGTQQEKSDIQIMLPNKVKLTIPQEKQMFAETIQLKRSIKLKKGFYKMWAVEGNNIVKMAGKLVDTANLMLDNVTMTMMINRATGRRLANPKPLTGQLWMWLIMGSIVGISIGYILYPQFNHPLPITVVCERLQNGTLIEQLTGKRC